MRFFDHFISIFFTRYALVTSSEDDLEFHCKFSVEAIAIPDTLPDNWLGFLQKRDSLSFTITDDGDDPLSFYSVSPELEFLSKLKRLQELYLGDERVEAELTIHKKKANDTLTIYDLHTFITTISEKTITQALAVFTRAFSSANELIFEVLNLDKGFHTSTVFFCPIGSAIAYPTITRSKVLEDVRSLSYFTNSTSFPLIPDDFKIINHNSLYEPFCARLEFLSSILAVVFLFDITSLTNNTLSYKLNGYKTLKGEVELTTLTNFEGYYKIYQWTFNSGNLFDKLGLARNIVSLHLSSGDLTLKGEPFQSIQSSYKVYEKQNIKQYIEIRNKISDQLLAFNERANKVIETFASGFQKSALALIGFYISAFAVKALGKGEYKNVFTLDAALLSAALIGGAYIYYRVSRWEVLQQRQRFVESYRNMKERYCDLLDRNDIDRILNNDKEYNSDVKFIDEKFKAYCILWRSVLWILFALTVVLFVINSINLELVTKIFCTSNC